MKVPLLDLTRQYDTIRDEIESAAIEVFESQRFIHGPKVEEFEQAMAEYCGSKYAVGVSSGSDALLISLMSAGIGQGDLVITTPFTFFATAGAIARVGAKPVFADIDSDTYNLDPVKFKELLYSLGKDQAARVKAVIPVHLYGQCADMEPILEAAQEFGLIVIEDAAQAIGSEYRFSDGSVKRAGSMGDYGCFSFFPSKNLGAFGDAGMVTTNSPELNERLKTMRDHGQNPKYYYRMIGGNFRLDALQAAILSIKLKYLDKWSKGRIKNAGIYKKLFHEKNISDIMLPVEKEVRHIYNQYVINTGESRDSLKEYLLANGVGCEIYYPLCLHEQDCFKYLEYKSNDFPVSEKAAKNTLAIPIFSELTGEELGYVSDIIGDFFNKK